MSLTPLEFAILDSNHGTYNCAICTKNPATLKATGTHDGDCCLPQACKALANLAQWTVGHRIKKTGQREIEAEMEPPMQRSRDETIQHIRDTVAALQAQVATSRELREISQNLRQENAELREFLRENLLINLAKRDHWSDT